MARVFRRCKGDNEGEEGLILPRCCFEGLTAPPAPDSCLKRATGSLAARSDALRSTFGADARPRGFSVSAGAGGTSSSSSRPFNGEERLNGSFLLPVRGLNESCLPGLNGSLLFPVRGLRDSRLLLLNGSFFPPPLVGLSTELRLFALEGSANEDAAAEPGLTGVVGERMELRRRCFSPRLSASSCSSSAASCASAS